MGWLHLRRAENDVLGVREHSAHGGADGALDVHEEGIRALNLSLELVHVLLFSGVNVNEIDFHFVLRCTKLLLIDYCNSNEVYILIINQWAHVLLTTKREIFSEFLFRLFLRVHSRL